MKKGHKFYFQFCFCGFYTLICPYGLAKPDGQVKKTDGEWRRVLHPTGGFSASESVLLSLCGCQVNLGLTLECGLGLKVHMFCLASSVSQLGLTLLWLQGLTCDPDSANQRIPPLWNGEGPLNLGQSEPSLELLALGCPSPGSSYA